MTKLLGHLRSNWRRGCVGAAVVVFVGLVLGWTRLGDGLVYLSFDLPYLFKKVSVPDDLVLVYLDEDSYEALQQKPGTAFKRSLHAGLVDHLTRDQARMIVFDIFFAEEGDEEDTARLTKAVAAHGNVVLAGVHQPMAKQGLSGMQISEPWTGLKEAAAGWGIAGFAGHRSSVIRSFNTMLAGYPSLPSEAARLAGGSTGPDRGGESVLWLQYYGPFNTLRSVSFASATNAPPGFYRDKFVWIGQRTATGFPFDELDEFATPYTRWDEGRRGFPGVTILATAFLNQLHEEHIRAAGVWMELWLQVLAGGCLAYLLVCFKPRATLLITLAGIIAVMIAGIALFLSWNLWIGWTVLAFAQLPVACGWSAYSHFSRLVVMKRGVPDHTMIRCVGRGAYGEVWLAKNEVGVFHAVKIIYRSAYDKAEPFDREFRGIQRYMPISRSHPGLLNILHVGRNDPEGYFYYIMEAADDVRGGNELDPATYVPHTLSHDLDHSGVIPPERCLEIMITLAEALRHIHASDLIHRDIKPSNIIFLNGVPKFADIGLVTRVSSAGRDVTLVGTLGYVAPEGPGSPAADIFSLGKVLYVMMTGQDPELFPELPTALAPASRGPLWEDLNRIVGKACDYDVTRRYVNAEALLADLERLRGGGDKTIVTPNDPND